MRNFLLLTILFGFIFNSCTVSAEENKNIYSTSHEIEFYTQSPSETKVTHKIVLDLKDKYTAIQNFKVVEPVSKIYDLQLENSSIGSISNEDKVIQVSFDPVLIGPSKAEFSYSYVTDNLFEKLGSTYKLDIPVVDQKEELDDFTIKIYIPENLDISELKYSPSTDELGTFILLNKEQLEKTGNSIILGNHMNYEVQIKNIVSPEKNYLVLLSSIRDRQKVFVKSISKAPDNVMRDGDGNIIFEYANVSSPQYIDITYLVTVYGNSTPYVERSGFEYTNTQKYWDYSHGLPDYYLTNYTSEDLDIENRVKKSYEFVTDYLSYNNDRLLNYSSNARIGAEKINEENKENAVCLEYSDLLIALLRGQNIKAREINGVTALAEDSSAKLQLHSWLEYVDSANNWVQIDPTWGDTSGIDYVDSFDYYHINLLRRGINSEYPLLPGSYEYAGKKETVGLKIVENLDSSQTADISYFNIANLLLLKNNSPNTLSFDKSELLPYQNSFVFGNVTSLKDNDGIVIKLVKTNLIDVLPKLYIFILVFFILSPALFFLVHMRLSSISKGKKRKLKQVRSIV